MKIKIMIINNSIIIGERKKIIKTGRQKYQQLILVINLINTGIIITAYLDLMMEKY